MERPSSPSPESAAHPRFTATFGSRSSFRSCNTVLPFLHPPARLSRGRTGRGSQARLKRALRVEVPRRPPWFAPCSKAFEYSTRTFKEGRHVRQQPQGIVDRRAQRHLRRGTADHEGFAEDGQGGGLRGA